MQDAAIADAHNVRTFEVSRRTIESIGETKGSRLTTANNVRDPQQTADTSGGCVAVVRAGVGVEAAAGAGAGAPGAG